MDTRNLVIGETDAFNKTHERWCQSKELVAINRKSVNFKIINESDTWI